MLVLLLHIHDFKNTYFYYFLSINLEAGFYNCLHSGMFSDPPIQTIACIEHALSPILYQAILKNGKTTLAHISKSLLAHDPEIVIQPQQRVMLEMTAFDFSSARIIEVLLP